MKLKEINIGFYKAKIRSTTIRNCSIINARDYGSYNLFLTLRVTR